MNEEEIFDVTWMNQKMRNVLLFTNFGFLKVVSGNFQGVSEKCSRIAFSLATFFLSFHFARRIARTQEIIQLGHGLHLMLSGLNRAD